MQSMRLFAVGCLMVVLGVCVVNEDAPRDVYWSNDKTF